MRRYLICRRTLTSALAVLCSACSEESLSLGGDLMLSISANSPVAVTDSLIVQYDVVGRSLLGLVLDHGDMEVDSLFFVNAQTAGGRVAHLYTAPGSYTIVGRVEDAFEGSLTKELTVTINP